MPKVLIITSNHGELAGKPNGTYLPELTHAVEVLTAEGIEYDLASPKGGKIPGYGEDADDVTKKLLADPEFAARLESTKCLDDVDGSTYDAIFYPGGYGLLFDLSDNATAHKLVTTAYESQKPIAAVCHGPAALAKIKLSDDETFLIADKQVTGFTREEEVAMGTLDAIPYLLEEKMMEGGAVYRKKAAWKELVVVDGLLITGQNPQSAHGVGKALAAMLKKE